MGKRNGVNLYFRSDCGINTLVIPIIYIVQSIYSFLFIPLQKKLS